MSETIQKIKKILVYQTNIDENKILIDADLVNDLGLDSLDTVEVIANIEAETGLNIPLKDAEAWKTLKDIAAYVETRTLENKKVGD